MGRKHCRKGKNTGYQPFSPFSTIFFKSLFFRMIKILLGLCGKGLTLSQTSPGFTVCSTSLLKTLWEKKELLVTSNFYFSHSVFYPFRELSTIFIKFRIVVCRLLQFGKSLKFVVWERVNALAHYSFNLRTLKKKAIDTICEKDR